MSFHTHTLPNGLQILGETNPAALSAALGFFVRTGARDEVAGEYGVTHFLEHMIFKGTEKRSSIDVNRDFDRIGADNNAFTSEENTVFHAAVLPEYLPQAVDVLADILRPSLRQHDFDTEKEVILDEIARYDVQPGYACYDKAKQIFFGSHALGQSVLGTNESITALTRDQMADYFQRRYVAPNILVVAAGNFDWPAFVTLIEQHCGTWLSGQIGRQGLGEAKGSGGSHTIKRENVIQEYVTFWSPGPAADSELRYAAHVLTSIIGDYSGSRLYWELVDKGLADSADMGLCDFEKAGAFLTSMSCEPDKAASNSRKVLEVFGDVQKNGVTDAELTVARTKLASREVRAGERTFRRMLGIGRDWTYLNEYRTLDDELEAIDAVDAKAIRDLLDRYPLTNVTTVALGPLDAIV